MSRTTRTSRSSRSHRTNRTHISFAMPRRPTPSNEGESSSNKRKKTADVSGAEDKQPKVAKTAQGSSLQHLQDQFDCKLCGNLLRTPIMLVEDVGNVCGSHQGLNHVGLPNTLLDLIIENVSFPCKYKMNGCTSIKAYKDLPDHQMKCIYRPMLCLHINCTWMGAVETIASHFLRDHMESIIDDQPFAIDLRENSRDETVKVLKKNNDVFFFRASKLDGDNLLYSVYKDDTGDNKRGRKAAQAVASLTHLGYTGEYKVQCDIKSICTAVFEEGVKVSKTVLRGLAQTSDFLKVTLEVMPKNKPNFSTEAFLKHLECAVCFSQMRKPIFVGNTCGHSVCGSCKPRLNRCGICRSRNLWIRNYTLEGVMEQLSPELEVEAEPEPEVNVPQRPSSPINDSDSDGGNTTPSTGAEDYDYNSSDSDGGWHEHSDNYEDDY